MATVLQAAQAATAARAVALARVADALVSDTSRVDAAKAAYDAGLAAELGKWPSWISFAETVGVRAADLNHTKEETGAFRAALDGIMDLVVRDAWQSPTVAKRVAEEKSLRAAGKLPDADAVAREIQSARTRRTELANVIRYGAVVGRYILDRMAQEGELAGVHKATVWAGVFSACNKRAAAIREEGGVITSDDLYSAAAAVLDGARKPEKTDDEKRSAVAAALNKAVGKASEIGLLSVEEVRKIRAVLDRNPATQESATDAEAAVKPVTRPSKPANGKAAKAGKAAKPATAPEAGKAAKPGKPGKPAKPAKVEGKAASDATKIAADVI
jgi:hypothetical protein